MLLEPAQFKKWRSKLDIVKQVVRRPHPAELAIQASAFVMAKRKRAKTIDVSNPTRIQPGTLPISKVASLN